MKYKEHILNIYVKNKHLLEELLPPKNKKNPTTMVRSIIFRMMEKIFSLFCLII